MAMQPFYEITDWQNWPSQKTAVGRRNLLKLENGVKEADNRLVQLDAKKAELATLNTMVKDVVMDPATGILTVTLLNGTKNTYDLDIEKVVTNFDINDDNELVLVLADGTKKTIDLTRFVYSVDSTATISMTITNRVMRATIVDGSVTMAKLDAAIQTEFRQYMLDAQTARDAALQYQKIAKRYTIGDEAEYPGSETDNAKYYYEHTKSDAETSGQNAAAAAESAQTAAEQAGIATKKATEATAAANNTAADVQTTTAKATAAANSAQAAGEKAADAAASEQIAKDKAKEAEDSAQQAKRYAVGGVVPEDTEDNAKYYYQQSKFLKDEIDATANLVVPRFYIDFATGRLMSDKAAQGMRFWIENGKLYGEMEVTA